MSLEKGPIDQQQNQKVPSLPYYINGGKQEIHKKRIRVTVNQNLKIQEGNFINKTQKGPCLPFLSEYLLYFSGQTKETLWS